MAKPKSNFADEDKNPCLEESKLSTKCMERNAYNHSMCTDYFNNYKMCKLFWGKLSSARQRAGIKPHMPTKLERDKILEQKKKGIEVISVPLE